MPEVQDESVEGASDVVYSAICSHHVQCDNRGATCGKNARRVLTTQIRSFVPDICLKLECLSGAIASCICHL